MLLMANLGTQMLLFDNMAVNMNGEKPLLNMMMDFSIHNGSFKILLHQTFFKKLRLFFIQLFFIYEVGKCPKYSGSESLPLLRHCRDPESQSSPRNTKILKIRDSFVSASNTRSTQLCTQLVSHEPRASFFLGDK